MTSQIRLRHLANAARAQGGRAFDFRTALRDAGLRDDGTLHELALAWARALPPGCRTLHDLMQAEASCGREIAALFDRAADLAAVPRPAPSQPEPVETGLFS